MKKSTLPNVPKYILEDEIVADILEGGCHLELMC